MCRIDSDEDVADGLGALLAADPRLAAISDVAGKLPLRRRPGGFAGLAAIVTAQQISNAAAAAIWARLLTAVDPFTAERFLATADEALRGAGLSRAKVATLSGVATAIADGFDLADLHALPPDDAIAAMVSLKGIGPWTAEIYLLFCIGHPDIFPAGDLALQIGVQHGLGLEARPTVKQLRTLAERWAPWRGIAARLFWAYYKSRRHALRE